MLSSRWGGESMERLKVDIRIVHDELKREMSVLQFFFAIVSLSFLPFSVAGTTVLLSFAK
jgi:hypothetical protein